MKAGVVRKLTVDNGATVKNGRIVRGRGSFLLEVELYPGAEISGLTEWIEQLFNLPIGAEHRGAEEQASVKAERDALKKERVLLRAKLAAIREALDS